MISLTQWVIASTFVLPSLAKLYNNPSELTKTTYDYIVVGGEFRVIHSIRYHFTDFCYLIAGAAGAVVAARLSEDPKISVLLVEAGITYVAQVVHFSQLAHHKFRLGMRAICL